jgi:hypothetical protein
MMIARTNMPIAASVITSFLQIGCTFHPWPPAPYAYEVWEKSGLKETKKSGLCWNVASSHRFIRVDLVRLPKRNGFQDLASSLIFLRAETPVYMPLYR